MSVRSTLSPALALIMPGLWEPYLLLTAIMLWIHWMLHVLHTEIIIFSYFIYRDYCRMAKRIRCRCNQLIGVSFRLHLQTTSSTPVKRPGVSTKHSMYRLWYQTQAACVACKSILSPCPHIIFICHGDDGYSDDDKMAVTSSLSAPTAIVHGLLARSHMRVNFVKERRSVNCKFQARLLSFRINCQLAINME